MSTNIKGTYKHFKGNIYVVIGVGEHTENRERHVVYYSEQDPSKIWIRPLDMFFDNVTRGDYSGPRFVKLS